MSHFIDKKIVKQIKSHSQGHITGKWQICVCCSLGYSSLCFKTSLVPMPSSSSDLPSLVTFLWILRAHMYVYVNFLVCMSLNAWALDPVPVLIKSSFWAYRAEGQPLELVDQHISTCKGCPGSWKPEPSLATGWHSPEIKNSHFYNMHSCMSFSFPQLCNYC